MKRFLTLIPAFLLCVATAHAQQPAEQWRTEANRVVTAGNRAYETSDHRALQRHVGELQKLLAEASHSGTLSTADSLVYTADWLKLRADLCYELAADSAALFPEAERLLHQAQAIYAHRPDLAQSHITTVLHEELAQLYYRQKRYAEAHAEMDSVADLYAVRIENGEIAPGEADCAADYDRYLMQLAARAMCRAHCHDFSGAHSDLDTALRLFSTRQGATYAELLRRKAKVLMLEDEAHAAHNNLQSALRLYRQAFTLQRQACAERLLTLNAEGRTSFWLHTRPFVADCFTTEGADAALLYDVVLFQKALLLHLAQIEKQCSSKAAALKALQTNWKDIQRQLRKGEAAVEFVCYELNGRERMGALVLKALGSPVWVQMPNPVDVTDYKIAASAECVADRTGSTSRRGKDELYTDSLLRLKVWPEALRRALRDTPTVLFAPDGYQHRLAIEYMWPESAPAARLYRLSSTRRLLERQKGTNLSGSALLCGDVDYYARFAPTATTNDSLAFSLYSGNRTEFPLLTHSAEEIEGIRLTRHTAADSLLCGAQATEQAFRQLATRYPLVFVSTHGDFHAAATPQGTDLKPCLTDQTLSENVMALSGVNTALASLKEGSATQTDGLLSARELADMDLSVVNLFVVSACQSALGFITADGVYGLQRGLKQAGAGALLLSLWSVNDEATATLMQTFMKGLESGKSLHDALALARISMQRPAEPTADASTATNAPQRTFSAAKLTHRAKAAPTSALPRYATPQYTDAFILIDALPN